jgi:hypothetical protein
MLLVAGCALMDAPARGARAQDSRDQGPSEGSSGGLRGAFGRFRAGSGEASRRRVSGPLGNVRLMTLCFGLLGLVGAILLVIADQTLLIQIKLDTVPSTADLGSHVKTYGHANHSYAMTILGIAALPMLLGAIRGHSRPALAAVLVLGVIAASIALFVDLPATHETGVIGQNFADATATPQIALKLELAGAGLLVICGGCLLILGTGADDEDGGSARRGSGGDGGSPRRRDVGDDPSNGRPGRLGRRRSTAPPVEPVVPGRGEP